MKRAIIPALLAFFLLAGAALAQGPAIPWSVIGSGGGHAEGGATISLDSTIGQPIVGQVSNLPYDLCAGFWCSGVGCQLYLPLVLRNY